MVQKRPVLLGLATVVLSIACGGDDGASPDARPSIDGEPQAIDAAAPRTVFGGDRPATLRVPTSYVPGTPTPLVLALHGYSIDGAFMESYSGVGTLYESEGFLLIAPDGTVDQDGENFWNATDACCDLFGTGVDDETYLMGLLDDIAEDYSVDPARVYLIGFSNGAFMSYRLACHHADRFAALVSMSGATYDTAADCAPTEPVSVLQLHGDGDPTIMYGGGNNQVEGAPVAYPSAQGTFDRWVSYNACGGAATDGTPRDLIGSLAGDETAVRQGGGCPADGEVELWTVAGGSHVLALNAVSRGLLWSFLEAHPKQ